MYVKVRPADGSLLAPDFIALPMDLIGLTQDALNDLGAVFPDRDDFQGVGYWPCREDRSAFIPNANMFDGTGTISVDTQARTAVRHANVRALTSDEIVNARQACKNNLATKRFAVETGGLTVSGINLDIKTDMDSAIRILGAAMAAQQSVFPPTWKDFTGNWVSVTPQDVSAIIQAALLHTKACFDNEHALSQQIDGSTAPGSIDISQGWPANPQPAG